MRRKDEQSVDNIFCFRPFKRDDAYVDVFGAALTLYVIP